MMELPRRKSELEYDSERLNAVVASLGEVACAVEDGESEVARNPRDHAISSIVNTYKSHPQVRRAVESQKTSQYTPSIYRDEIGNYLGEAGSYRLLAAEEEQELFTQIDRGYQCYEMLGETEEAGEEFEQAFIDAAAAHQRIYMANLRLVYARTKSYIDKPKSGGVEPEDYLYEAQEGLLTAISRFDVSRGYKFSTFATPWIQQKAIRLSANHTRAVRISEKKHWAYVNAKQQVADRQNEVGRELTPAEIEQETDLSYDAYKELMQIGSQVMVSLDAKLPNSDEDDDWLMSMYTQYEHVEQDVLEQEASRELRKLLDDADMKGRDRLALGLRYGLDPEIIGDIEVGLKDESEKKSYREFYAQIKGNKGANMSGLARELGLAPNSLGNLMTKTIKDLRKQANKDSQ